MRCRQRIIPVVPIMGMLVWAAAIPAGAADIPPGIETAARCAVRAGLSPAPSDALRIIGTQEPTPRRLFGTRDLLIIDGGTGRGVQLGQQFFIRRAADFGDRHTTGPRAVGTGGWLRIVSANDTTAIGMVEFACDGIFAGDYLEPYVEPVLPPDADRADTTGDLDFTKPARVLFGYNERRTAGTGDFMVIDVGSSHGADPGVRFAVYRDVHTPGVPLAPVGEVIVVHADTGTAVVRVTSARDAVRSGDLLIPRRR